MERTHNSFHNYSANYYSQAHQENAQYASQPGVGQTSGASAANMRVGEQFLAGLNKYAQDAPLKDCSATLDFEVYVTDDGKLTGEGQALCNNLPPGEQWQVNRALQLRGDMYYMPQEVKVGRFLAGLELCERGGLMLEQSSQEASINLNRYITDDGNLQPGQGEALYNSLSMEDQITVDLALRFIGERQLHMDRIPFMASLENYARGAPITACSGDVPFSRYVTDDGYLEDRGESLYDILSDNEADRLDAALLARRKVSANRSAYVQQREVGGYQPTYFQR
ncbi:MAG: hypothetical protein P8X89_06085 [Reinekea sp.]|jgi:hypothetical protein